MSVSEGQPPMNTDTGKTDPTEPWRDLTESQGRYITEQAAEIVNLTNRVRDAEAVLAREREAMEAVEDDRYQYAEYAANLEGRVRELEEALERIASWTEAAHTTAEVRAFAREALVGLPE